MQPADQNIDDYTFNNVSEYLRLNAEKHPDKPALLYPVRISYRQMQEEADRYSFGLESAGIKRGTRTILLVPAGAEFFKLTFALLRIGAIPVMIDPGMGIKAMLRALAEVDAEAFIGIPKAHLLRFIRPSVFKSVKTRLTVMVEESLRGQIFKYNSSEQKMNYPVCKVSPDDIAALFFTSGSTGQAKGVIYTAGMLKNQIQVTRSQFNIGSGEIDLCTFPLLGLFAICHGNSSVLADMDMIHPAKSDPSGIIRNILDFGCTQMFGSPMILKKLSDYGIPNNIRLPSLRNIISAGAPVHPSILEAFSQMISSEARVHTPYGATEALPVTDIDTSELLMGDSDEIENRNGICIGYPVTGLEVRIIEITDNQIISWSEATKLSVDEVGEIVVKGPWVAIQYFNNPEANKLAKIPDPVDNRIWHRMGDLGRIDSMGRIWFYGRKSHRVITNSGTLFTIPCEAVFNQHPHVARSALVGIPASASGFKKPVICIEPEQGCRSNKKFNQELLSLGSSSDLTKGISDILFIKKFPVDPRHNAKIFREKLAVWAAKKIK